MSIFGTILAKLKGHSSTPTSPVSTASSASSATAAPGAVAPPATVGSSPAAPAAGSAPPVTAAASASSSTAAITPFDVEAILNGLAAKKTERLDWKHSIVDLMKLLDLDSSLTARKELAGELSYSGDTNDSATMNMWLHKQVMQKLAANGGRVPADLAQH